MTDKTETWYEAQRLVNAYPDGSGGEWIEWETFPYDLESCPESKRAATRLSARHGAIRAARKCAEQREESTRVIHCELIEENVVKYE